MLLDSDYDPNALTEETLRSSSRRCENQLAPAHSPLRTNWIGQMGNR